MNATLSVQTTPSQFLISIEDRALVNDVCRAIKMLKGVTSIRIMRPSQVISPSLAAKLNKARKEYAAGETISCHTPEEMNRFFESL